MNSQHLVDEKLKAPEKGGTDPGGAKEDLEPGQVLSGGQPRGQRKGPQERILHGGGPVAD